MAATETSNNIQIVGSGVFCAVRAETAQRGPNIMRGILEMVVRRLGGWCMMAASLGASCETVAGQ
jgi:hypothetical protein